ncbi:hypothetical protein Pst134EA_015867 [Puccinia striiformis f. sp. tritici]|uniref:hypothetical protein n=1 Tax=Puccinia striiformis f. sp. tritici TaxID=168172 RepID=UPI0020078AD3|nr:hypothetical protein Pst134EA_015867 [Puccinia striiformis f. sp. tritici]KAH9463784.1 hypothetical protein Pst134EA_015867 [Puccinia striiformis f. sp. tritici]
MSAITPTQPPLTPINTSQHTTQNSQALAPTEGTTASQTQNTPARGRGSRGRGCGETRGGLAVELEGGLAVGLVVERPINKEAEPHIALGQTISAGMGSQRSISFKREVDEVIVEYIIENGGGKRKWEGVDQQITNLEKKFRAALAYQSQTGQGILDAADELARQAAANPDDSEAEDYVGQAVTETETAIRKICKYF